MAASPESFLTLDQVDEYYKVLVYAEPGEGKTTALAGLARKGHIIYIDAENGLKPKALRRQGIPIENIEPWKDCSYAGLEELYQRLLVRLADGEDIKGLCWDTGTEQIRVLIRESVEAGIIKAENIGKKRSEFDVFLDDFGVVTEQMRKILRQFHGLNLHLGIACHVRRDKDDEGAVTYGPALTPAVAADFRGYLDCIVHLRTTDFGDDEPEHSGLTRKKGKYEAKDRYGLLPTNMIDPSFDRIVDYLDEKLVKETDPLQVAARARRAAQSGNSGEGVEKKATSAVEGDVTAKAWAVVDEAKATKATAST